MTSISELEQRLAELHPEKEVAVREALRKRLAPLFARHDAQGALRKAQERLEVATRREDEARQCRDQALVKAAHIREQALEKAARTCDESMERATREYERSSTDPEARLAYAVEVAAAARATVAEKEANLAAAAEALVRSDTEARQ